MSAILKNLLTPKNNWSLSQGNFNLAVVIHFTAIVGLAGHLLFIFLFLWLGVRQMAWLNLASCAIFVLCFWLNRRGWPHQALLLGLLEVSIHAVVAVRYVGWDSGFHYYMIALIPLIYYSQTWRVHIKMLLAGLLCASYISLYYSTLLMPPVFSGDPDRLRVVGVVNIITLFIVFSALAYYYRLAATDAETALKRANKSLHIQARIDSLTNLANRRHVSEYIDELVAVDRITHKPFSIILADIDNFKMYNDTYGHSAADEILVKVAEALQDSKRENDLVGRWGGEEFLVVLPETRVEGALFVAERMRQKIASLHVTKDGVESNVTMTFGVSTYQQESDSSACINRADQAMYQGKLDGKNCVRVFGE